MRPNPEGMAIVASAARAGNWNLPPAAVVVRHTPSLLPSTF